MCVCYGSTGRRTRTGHVCHLSRANLGAGAESARRIRNLTRRGTPRSACRFASRRRRRPSRRCSRELGCDAHRTVPPPRLPHTLNSLNKKTARSMDEPELTSVYGGGSSGGRYKPGPTMAAA
eukprot:5513795-Prymnesium_polylepis.1